MQPHDTNEPTPDTREALIEHVPILLGRMDAAGAVKQTEGSLPHAGVIGGIVAGESNLLDILSAEDADLRGDVEKGRTHLELRAGSTETPAYFELRLVPDPHRGSGSYFSIHDITETRRLQHALLDCTDNEQMRVGQELHDTLGQQLTGLAYQAQALEDISPPHLQERFAALQENISHCLRQARDVSFHLSPHISDGDVSAAILRLCAHIRGTFGVACDYRPQLSQPLADDSTAFHLLRIAQEACTNAVRHASPTRIEIRLTTGAQKLLEIENDGADANVLSGPEAPGMGLPMMKFRARAVGGSLRLLPREPSGSVVRCRFENKLASPSASEDHSCPKCQ